MGTLYECLREARLEQFYPAFRANGITQSESLINLGMPEICALGITANEDKRRLMELVNIIKEVHSSSFSASPLPQRRSLGYRPDSQATLPEDGSQGQGFPDGARGLAQARHRHRLGGRAYPVSSETTPATDNHPEGGRESMIPRDRIPNFSAASYLDMLPDISDSSGSDAASADSSDEETAHPRSSHSAQRNMPATVSLRASATGRSGAGGAGAERTKSKGYNYGVHKVGTPSKTKSSRSSRAGREDRIKVCVRKRPLTRREIRAKDEDIVNVESTSTLMVNEPKLAVDLKAYTLQHELYLTKSFMNLARMRMFTPVQQGRL